MPPFKKVCVGGGGGGGHWLPLPPPPPSPCSYAIFIHTGVYHRGKMLSFTGFVAQCQLFLHDSPATTEGQIEANRTILMELIGL